ncbi:MAG: 16S rRNA (guanine(527)-N(7))-methyltransferase RsmG [Bacteroides sp.]|nr:16S rRNA (guanine(527)-N(7))-methyltransferase RsmG [Bacteroides sp.]MCM1095313.1 16S rRNA (guanine(527)-N(7))-methyltransferase RsmG [Terasakiella sp.]
MELVNKYFPGLTQTQREQYDALAELYPEWNAKINVISRRDIDNLEPNHVLHSLAIARFWGELAPGTRVLDLGTGGGFPGIPLAIMYPQAHFHLIDRVAKKLRVAEDIARRIGLQNVTIQHGDAGECHERYDYVVSRAVMPLADLVRISARNVGRAGAKNRYAPGIVCLKGGDLAEEIAAVRRPVTDYDLAELLPEPAFDTKKLIYVPVKA